MNAEQATRVRKAIDNVIIAHHNVNDIRAGEMLGSKMVTDQLKEQVARELKAAQTELELSLII